MRRLGTSQLQIVYMIHVMAATRLTQLHGSGIVNASL